jgi:hypothetical protein
MQPRTYPAYERPVLDIKDQDILDQEKSGHSATSCSTTVPRLGEMDRNNPVLVSVLLEQGSEV